MDKIIIKSPVFNASHELVAFDGIDLDDKGKMIVTPESTKIANAVKALPRLSPYTGSSAPRVSVNGTEYSLAYKFFTDAEKETYKSYRDGHKGSGGSVKSPSANAKKLDAIARVVLADKEMQKKLGEENVEFLKTCVLEDPKILAAIKAFMALGFTEEQARAAISQKK